MRQSSVDKEKETMKMISFHYSLHELSCGSTLRAKFCKCFPHNLQFFRYVSQEIVLHSLQLSFLEPQGVTWCVQHWMWKLDFAGLVRNVAVMYTLARRPFILHKSYPLLFRGHTGLLTLMSG